MLGSVNLLSKFAAALHKAEPIGKERDLVINTASVAAFDGLIGQKAYSASKGGIVGMTLPIARELARHAMRVMTIAPGNFWTPLLATLPHEAQDSPGRQVPFPRGSARPTSSCSLSILSSPILC